MAGADDQGRAADFEGAARADATVEELREREERYRQLFDAGDAVFVHELGPNGRPGRFLEVNDVACRRLGYGRDELLALSPKDINAPWDPEALASVLARYAAGEAVTFEQVHLTRDGRRIPVEIHGRPFTFKGRPAVIALVRDITERKQTEEALRRSEETFRALIETTQTGYVILDLEGRVVDANAEYLRLAGRTSLAAIVGRSVVEWTAPYDRERNAAEVARCLERGQVRGLEIDYVDAQGRTTPIELNATVVGQGASAQILTLCRDISGRKRAEQKRRQREERFRAIVETTAEWIWAIDTTGRHTYSNRGVERILGYTPEELAGQPARALLHPEERARVESLLRAKTAAGEGWTGLVLRWRHKDGSDRYLESNAVPILDSQGRLVGYQGSDRDITERKRAEAERERLQSELTQAQKMEAIGRLAGGVAHDFNNLLTALRGYADLTLLELDPGSRAAHNQRGIQEVVEQAKALTQQILAFSRRQVLQMANVDLNAELLSTGKMLRRLIGEEIEIVTSLQPDLRLVRGDKTQLQQVVVNLAINARDAMPHGGKLTISTSNAELPAELLPARPEPHASAYVKLTMADTGLGMDADTRNRVFEPFFTTKELGRGTGLGLATAYGIVRQHGGFIDVESAPGAGSLFTVYLPCAEAATQAEAPASSAALAARGSETILVVEDDTTVRELVCRQLADCGYRVLAAVDPQEAFAQAFRHDGPIALVLTDVVMPGMNGREMYARLSTQRPGLRVLYMSGYAGEALAHHGGVLDAGLRLIQKPFSIADLTRAVREILDAVPAAG
jgi:two-component system, cell cycle sensor histidine kinase and response regulator CckA